MAISPQSPTKQVLLTLRTDHVSQLDNLVVAGAASNRSELVDKVVGGFLADLRNKPNQQNQESALANLIAFILIVVGIAAILKALGAKN